MAFITMRGAAVLLSLQSAQAVVAGSVRNGATNEPLAEAIVSMSDMNRRVLADSAGHYVFRQVPAGPHHIAVRALGFAPRTVHALVPTGGVLEINVALVPSKTRLPTLFVRPAIAVRGMAEERETRTADRRATIAAVRNNPMLTEPDMLMAVSGGTIVARPESPSGLHIRGGASDHVAYLLDGIPVFSPYHAAGMFSAWNPDAMSAVTVSSSMPNPGDLASLSGTVAATTRAPSERLSALGSVSTTQARVTVDGLLGDGGASMMLSLRAGLPSVTAPRHEQSYVRGETGDRLGRVETPLFGGRLRLLGFESVDEITTSAVVSDAPTTVDDPPRNAYRWRSRSVGGEWRGLRGGGELRLLGWRAASDAGATWSTITERVSMESSRDDAGMLVAATHTTARSTTVVGTRLEQSRTSYSVNGHANDLVPTRLAAQTFITTAFAQHEHMVTNRTTLNADLSLAAFRGRVFVGPRARWQWKATERVSLSSSYARLHQFAQSLRNQESITGTVFPVELYIGAGGVTVPVARSEQGIVSASYQMSRGPRLSAEVFRRRLNGIVLVAASNTEPFATHASTVGDGMVRGVGVDASMSRSRYGVVVSYGRQRVRYAAGSMTYVPEHGAAHTFDGGVTAYPVPSLSIRLGVAGALGRRTTPVAGTFEWEACNLRDRGCEFGGSPRTSVESLGRSTLPGYLRADLGVRKHWHAEIGGRDMVVALFGALTNVTGRQNILTYVNDPVSGVPSPVDMRPRAPLVVGMEWRF